MRIKITGRGIHTLAGSDDNPSGEAPIGHEMDVEFVPPGWEGRVEVISGKPSKDAVAITNDDVHNSEVGHDPGNPGDPAPAPDAPRRGRPRSDA